MAITVTATAGGSTANGILLRVLVLDNAALAGTPATATQSGAAAHQAAITTTVTGSNVYGSIIDNFAATVPMNGGCTDIDNVVDSTNTQCYATFFAGPTGTPGLQTDGSVASFPGGAAMMEVLASGGSISTDASSPAVADTFSAHTITSASFAPPAGKLIVALVCANGGAGITTMNVSDSSSMTWTERARANTAGNFYTGVWTATVPAAAPSITTSSLPGGTQGSAYSQTLAATGGVTPYSWSILSGSLPVGLGLNASTGVISGIPSGTGLSSFTAEVTDNVGATDTQPLSIIISPATSVRLIENEFTADTDGYGPETFAMGPVAAGNALLAIVGCANNNPNALPRFALADDMHNWWDYAGTSSSIFPGGNRRLDVWVAPNIRGSTNATVMASLSSVFSGMAGAVLELGAFPDYAQVDVQAQTGGFGTSGSLSPVATGSDFCVTAIMFAGGSPGTVTGPGAGWTNVSLPFGTGSVIGDMSELTIYAAYGTFAAGSVASAWSWTSATNWSAITVCFDLTPSTPSQPNPYWPALKIEAAFGFQPGDTLGSMPPWTDITTRAIDESGQASLAASRGRGYELTQPEAGALAMRLNNLDGAFNPQNTSSPYYPNVLPEVPVRASAAWDGVTYGLAYSYARKWPQTFTADERQWGTTPYQGGDTIGLASQIALPSAYAGEALADSPYCLYPLSEFYSEANGMLFSNLARYNLKPMVGADGPASGGTPANPLATGQTLGLAGDPGTGIGISGLTAYSGSGGPGAFVRDSTLPALNAGATVEFWCIPTYAGTGTGQEVLDLVFLLGPPSNFNMIDANTNNPLANGTRFAVQAFFDASVLLGHDFMRAQLVDYNLNTSLTASSGTDSITSGKLYHVVCTMGYSGGTWTLAFYMNGILQQRVTGADTSSAFDLTGGALVAGPVPVCGGEANLFNYVIGQVAVYPWGLSQERILAHYNTGLNAATGDTVAQRAGKLCAWDGAQLPVVSLPASPSPLIGNADQIQGEALADALYNLTIDEGGMFYCPATSQGELLYVPRTSLYNKSPKYVLGDNPNPVTNINPSFEAGTTGWTSTKATIVQDSTHVRSGSSAGLMTVTGSPPTQSFVRTQSAVDQGVTYQAEGWVYSPIAWPTVHINMDWLQANGTYISTTSGVASAITAGAWTRYVVQGTPPSNAASVIHGPTFGGTPTNGMQFWIDDCWLSVPASEIPYDPGSGFNYDDTFLYNIVSSQRTISSSQQFITGTKGEVQTGLFNSYGVTAEAADFDSQTQFLPRGPLEQDIETTSDQDAFDRANWSLAKYHQPVLRANQVRLDPASNPLIWPVALGVEQGDVVTVIRRPLGGGPTISLNCIVQKVEHSVGPDVWFTTLTLAPYFPENAVIQLDNTSFNELGDGVLGW